eukprot:EG_transcript_22788
MPKYFARSWSLQGSMDGKAWTTLREHQNDKTMHPQQFYGHWDVDAKGRPQSVLVTFPPPMYCFCLWDCETIYAGSRIRVLNELCHLKSRQQGQLSSRRCLV